MVTVESSLIPNATSPPFFSQWVRFSNYNLSLIYKLNSTSLNLSMFLHVYIIGKLNLLNKLGVKLFLGWIGFLSNGLHVTVQKMENRNFRSNLVSTFYLFLMKRYFYLFVLDGKIFSYPLIAKLDFIENPKDNKIARKITHMLLIKFSKFS